MRLIDVDELKRQWGYGDTCDKCQRDSRKCQYEEITRMDVCSMLDDAPTVEPKEQEPIEPTSVKDAVPLSITAVKMMKKYYCGQCDTEIIWKQKYCHECGRKVKWNATD